MNNAEKDGLKKIYLFKSADYQFAEIDLSDNTLLLGESGVGKTTLMRAILFFYTMDGSSSALNINTESKKSFNQWYFKEHNSHIVYEYYKEGNPFLFVVSNSGNLHYTFIEMSKSDRGVKELFLEGRDPVTLEQLNENIEKNLLVKYHTTQKEKYIRAFHKKDMDGKRIKQESKIDFTLFETMTARKEFAKTLSNIFATSKVSADSVKKTIVSLIEDTSSDINLKNIRESLEEYVQFREQIRRFEKKIPQINELQEFIAEYRDYSLDFKQYANQIYLLKSQSDIKLLELNINISKEKEKKEKVEVEYRPKIRELKEDIRLKNEENIIENNDIDKLKKKKIEYEAKNIDALVAEYHQKKSYENSLEQTQNRYDALTANADEVKRKYNEIFNQLEVNRQKSILEIREELGVKKEEISSQKSESYRNQSEEIEEKTSLLLKEKSEGECNLSLEEKSLNEKNIEKAKVENFLYNQENIEKYQDKLKKFTEEVSNLKIKIPTLEGDIKQLDKQIESIPRRLVEEKDNFSAKVLSKKDNLISQKENIEKKLNFDKDNLYGYINRNELEERENLLTFLKDELLFSEKKLTVNQVDNSSSILGLNIEFEDNDFGFDYDVSSLQSELTVVKEKIKELDRRLRDDINLLEESARKETSKLNKDRTKHFKEKVEIEKQIEKYKSYMIKSENSLVDANKEAKQMRSKALEELTKSLFEQEDKIATLRSKITTLSLNIKTISDEIKTHTQKTILKLDSDLALLNDDEKKSVTRVEEKYLKDKKESELELTNRLEESGVDKEHLKKLDDEIRDYRNKLKEIEKNFGYVSTYLTEYFEAIKNIPFREENLEKKRVEEKDLVIKLNKLQDDFNEKLNSIDGILEKIYETKKKIDDFIVEYDKEIENKEIYKDMKNLFTLEYKEDMREFLNGSESLTLIIDKIVDIHKKLNISRDAIKNKTLLTSNGLAKENIFKLEIIDDYMKESNDFNSYLLVANGLVEYIEKDKISYLKDSSSDKFISEFNSISKYIDLFESSLLDVEEKVNKLDKRVKKAVDSFNVIDAIRIKKDTANNQILENLKIVTDFYTQNREKFISGLFVSNNREESHKSQNELGSKIEKLVEVLASSKEYLSLQEGFVLTFTVTEKGNKLKPAQSLNDIGSNGTSTLVKTIINISLLEMVNKNSQILNHCILDEIGTISPSYFRELKDYANSSGFLFVNGMPTEDDILISMYPTVYIGQNHGKYSRMLLASKMVV